MLVSKFLRHLGGVETYVDSLARGLTAEGHSVALFGMDLPGTSPKIGPPGAERYLSPDREFNGSFAAKVSSGASAVYSPTVGRRLHRAMESFLPDVVHFHGTCYQLTPSVYRAVSNARVPAILTAHEYKLVCANQRLWDDSKSGACTACVGRGSLGKARAILDRRCVKGSVGASSIAAIEQVVADQILRTSGVAIHAPSRYMEATLTADGYDSARIIYRDLPWEGQREANRFATSGRDRAVYIGRLAAEKGVDRLLRAWADVESRMPLAELLIAGDGPEAGRLRELSRTLRLNRVTFIGRYEQAELPKILSRAVTTVHPSVWAENSPFTVRESLLSGVPAIVSDRGGLPEMVDIGSGTVVDPDDTDALAAAICSEYRRPRVGSPELRTAVQVRAQSIGDHLHWLLGEYSRLVER